MSLLATQLARHPNLRRIRRDVMQARHPAKDTPTGQRYVPAVHTDPQGDVSLFMHATVGSNKGYAGRVLPDGRTIEYHPSPNMALDGELDRLVGQEVTLYVQCGEECREGKVIVDKAPDAQGLYHLRTVPPPPPSFEHPPAGPTTRVSWADM